MHRSTPTRTRRRRIAGWSIVGVLYIATLMFAASLTAPQETGAAQPPGSDRSATQPAAAAQVMAAYDDEAPLATLSVAAALVAGAAGWYLVHLARRRHRLRTAAIRSDRKLPRGLTIPG